MVTDIEIDQIRRDIRDLQKTTADEFTGLKRRFLLISPSLDLDRIPNGLTYAKLLLGDIDVSDGHILLTAITGDLDDIADGIDYGRILTTSISAGKIVLTGGAGVDGSLPVGNTDADVTADQFTNTLGTIDSETDKVELGLDASGRLVKAAIPGEAAATLAPVVAGLYLTSDFTGYYDGTSPYNASGWDVFIKSDGTFEFGGDGSNYITWNGATLDIRGTLNADDITAGTITGRTIQTAATGQRFIVSAADNKAYWYDAGSNEVVRIGEAIAGTAPGIKITNGVGYFLKGSSTGGSTAVYGRTEYAGNAISQGVTGIAIDAVGDQAVERIGVLGDATISGATTATAIGILGQASGGGINWAGYFGPGDVYIRGNLSDGTNALTVLNAKTAYDLRHARSHDHSAAGDGTRLNPAEFNFPVAASASPVDGDAHWINGSGGVSKLYIYNSYTSSYNTITVD